MLNLKKIISRFFSWTLNFNLCAVYSAICPFLLFSLGQLSVSSLSTIKTWSRNPKALKFYIDLQYDHTQLVTKNGKILPSKSTFFTQSNICYFSLSDPRFGVKIWSVKVSSISLKFGDSRGKRLSLSMQKEFLKLIDREQSYSAPFDHNFERQFSSDILITH